MAGRNCCQSTSGRFSTDCGGWFNKARAPLQRCRVKEAAWEAPVQQLQGAQFDSLSVSSRRGQQEAIDSQGASTQLVIMQGLQSSQSESEKSCCGQRSEMLAARQDVGEQFPFVMLAHNVVQTMDLSQIDQAVDIGLVDQQSFLSHFFEPPGAWLADSRGFPPGPQ